MEVRLKNRIAELRSEHGLTQQGLADEMGVSRQTVISLEKGRYNPSILLAHRIASRFGLYIEQVFVFEESE